MTEVTTMLYWLKKEALYFIQQSCVACINHTMSADEWQVNAECAVRKTGAVNGSYVFQGDVYVFPWTKGVK
jgi:hypothetical protein